MVTVKGAVPPADVRALLAAHDLLWAPSMYAEGQPYALLEALEAGLPALVCTPNAAMRELVDDCVGALIPVAADAQALASVTASLAAAPAELQRLQHLARQMAERRFAIDAVLPLWRAGWALTSASPLQHDPRIRASSS
jgi:glycosyltransferase involved in cell wall biosynthesis